MKSTLIMIISVALPIVIARAIDAISSNYSKKLSKRTKPDYYMSVYLINIVIYAIFFSLLNNLLQWVFSSLSIDMSIVLYIGTGALLISFAMSYAILMKVNRSHFGSISKKHKLQVFLYRKYLPVAFMQLISSVSLLNYMVDYFGINNYSFQNSIGINFIFVLFIYSFYASYSNFHFSLSPMTEVEQMKVIFMNNKEISCTEVRDEKDMICISRSGMNGNEQIVNDLYVNKSSVQSIIYEKRFVFPVYNYLVERLK